jgi:quinone-modifying oxidoreductase subunit QmoC
MAEQVLKPDLDFVKGVIAAGGDSLKKCYQCATCSVVCNVTPDQKPFPRKEMVWAQWGLKEKFEGNPDVWLCHQCNDCTAYCPRGAKPGEVLGAIRKQAIQKYSAPAALACIVNSKKFLPLIFIVPAILIAIIISLTGNWSPAPDPVRGIVFENFMNILPIQLVFTPALIFGIAVGVLGLRKFWADMKKAAGVTSGNVKGSVIDMLKEFLPHTKFKDCDVSRDRFTSHLLVFYSFVALGLATAFGVLYIDILGKHSPFSFGYGTPVKLFGFIGAIAILAGTVLMIKNRMKNAEKVGMGSYFDWLLLGIIGIIGLSGTLAWITRVAGAGPVAYPMYFIHLVFVFSLFIYLPYSKLAHVFYRGAALAFNRYSGREAQQSALPQASAETIQAQPEAAAEPAEGETKTVQEQ